MTFRYLRAVFCALMLAAAQPALANKKYGPGVTDTEVKIGQTMPYSGPRPLMAPRGAWRRPTTR